MRAALKIFEFEYFESLQIWRTKVWLCFLLLYVRSNLKGGSQSIERDEKDGAEECLEGSLELKSNGADPTHSTCDNSKERSLRAQRDIRGDPSAEREDNETDADATGSGSWREQ